MRSRRALLLLSALTAALPARLARGEDVAARARFVADRDARALLGSLEASADASDRTWLPVVRLAADPAARTDATSGLAALLDALRTLDLAAARRHLDGMRTRADDPLLPWLDAVVAERGGRDDDAVRRLLDARTDPERAAFPLAVLGAALPGDDRDALVALVRRASVLALASGRLDDAGPLARAAAAVDRGAGDGVRLVVARGLRRVGREGDARAMLAPPAAPGPWAAAVALERALAAWRAGDGEGARRAAAAAPKGDACAVALAALAAAKGAPSVLAAPPLAVLEPEVEPSAAALARLVAVLGATVRAEDLAARAAGRRTGCADAAFVRETVAAAGGATLELEGDAAVAREALLRGLPLFVRRMQRRAAGWAETAVLARGYDPATDLVVLDDPDPTRADVMPAAALGKLRFAVAALKPRAAELDAWRATEAARRGASLGEALAPLAAGDAAGAAAALSRPEMGGPRPVLDLYLGACTWLAAMAAKDEGRRALAGGLLRRSAATEPVLPFERYVRVTEGSWGRDEADAAAADLAAIERDEGPCAWVHGARFVVLESARFHAEASAALDVARALDPLDVLTLYFRGSARRIAGDLPGARADLARVLDRRPDTLAAAEDLVPILLDAGETRRALEVVSALVAADPSGAKSPRVRQLRLRTEVRLVRQARAVGDLVALAASPEPDTRKEVAWTVASFESPEAETVLRRLLDDADEGVRRKAVQAFQRPWLADRVAADAALLGALRARLETDAAPTVRESVAFVLSHVEAPDAVAALVARLAGPRRDADAAVRAAVAEALAGRDTPATRDVLVAALDDEASSVRSAAVRVLRRVAGTTNGFAPDDPPDRRATAVRAWRAWLAAGR
ncbi:MAG: HEAT repeat domain-containing protein [Planctomycetes bacterium]|nr:HEAT repeat domain-containing protein [Planctomycetota bacterium]